MTKQRKEQIGKRKMNETEMESLDNLMKKVIDGDKFDKYDREQAGILLVKIKYLRKENES